MTRSSTTYSYLCPQHLPCAPKPSWSFTTKILTIVGTTVAFETIQYVFAIGRADITDILASTLGGLPTRCVLNQLSKKPELRVANSTHEAHVPVSRLRARGPTSAPRRWQRQWRSGI